MIVQKIPLAAPSLAGVAPRYRTAEQAAQHFDGFWLPTTDLTTRTGTAITTVSDLSANSNLLRQSLTGRYPALLTDPQTGLEGAYFDPDRTKFMTADDDFDPREPFTLFALVKLSIAELNVVPSRANACLLGHYDADETHRAFVNATQTGQVQSFLGDDGDDGLPFPGMPIRDRRWQLVMACYDGSGTGDTANRLRLDGHPPEGGPVATEPQTETATGSTLWMGYSASGFASAVGLVGCAGVASLDLLAPSHADKLQDLVDFLDSYAPGVTTPLRRPYLEAVA